MFLEKKFSIKIKETFLLMDNETHFCIDWFSTFDFDWGSDNWIVNLAMILIVVSSLLDFHGSLAGDKRTTEVRGYQVLHFAALSS